MKLGRVVVAVALAAVCTTSAQAQGGTDLTVALGALSFISSDGESAFGINVNQQQVRLGLPLTSKVMIEPTVSIAYLSSEGTSFTDVGLGAVVPFYLGASSEEGVYVAPGAGINISSFHADVLGSESTSQLSLVGELGSKNKVSESLAIRLAAQLQLGLENDDNDGFTAIRGIFGITIKL